MKQGTVRRRFSVFALAQLLWSAACFFVFCWVALDTLPLVACALLGLPALVLASPSLLLVVYMMDQMAWSLPNGGGARFGLWLAGAILLAGLLPPLLFFLGSLLGAGRTEENSVSGS